MSQTAFVALFSLIIAAVKRKSILIKGNINVLFQRAFTIKISNYCKELNQR